MDLQFGGDETGRLLVHIFSLQILNRCTRGGPVSPPPKIGGQKMLIKSPEKHPYVLYQCENAYLLVIESIIHAIRIVSTEFFTGRFFGSSPPLELVTSSESSLDARSGEG